MDITVTAKGWINYVIPCSGRDVANYCGNPNGRRWVWDREKEECAEERMRKRKEKGKEIAREKQ